MRKKIFGLIAVIVAWGLLFTCYAVYRSIEHVITCPQFNLIDL